MFAQAAVLGGRDRNWNADFSPLIGKLQAKVCTPTLWLNKSCELSVQQVM